MFVKYIEMNVNFFSMTLQRLKKSIEDLPIHNLIVLVVLAVAIVILCYKIYSKKDLNSYSHCKYVTQEFRVLKDLMSDINSDLKNVVYYYNSENSGSGLSTSINKNIVVNTKVKTEDSELNIATNDY